MKSLTSTLETDSIPAQEWKSLAKKKIFFGHKSVGYNIIDGIQDVMKKNRNIVLDIRNTKDLGNVREGVFAHSENGENGNPKSKIDAFVKTMENGMGGQADIALFKFCYVDFNENSNTDEIVSYYKSAMNGLAKKYPKVTYLHVTVPLTTEGELLGLGDKMKDIVKKILGRPARSELNALSNIKRNEYNSRIIKEFGKEAVIDIARFESTYPDGTQKVSKNGGTEHAALIPDYTTDGGHLNETGRILVADRFLARLAGIR